MPEGPTIKVTGDRLRDALAGRTIDRFVSRFKKAATEGWRGKIEGAQVLAVRAHGKNLFIDFNSGYTLYSHI